MTSSIMISKFAHLQIPLEDVLNATNNFHQDNIIGDGGLGSAYKGQLKRSGKLVKISALRLDRKRGEAEVQFWREISMLSDLNHTNLVSIIGFCDEIDEKVIITTYSAKGSLAKHLNNPSLTWTKRLKICLGVARALSYLYRDEARDYCIIHRNINSFSILVDKKWEPKLSGFKVSVKQSVNQVDQVILSKPIGTIGYMDPEVETTKGFTHKSDIYSFGVVLFELLCGRSAYAKNESDGFLAQLAKYHYEKETLPDIIHPDLRSQMSPHSLRIYSKVAYSCLEKERGDRPNIFIVVDKLEKALKQALKFNPDFGMNLENLKIPLNDIKFATNNFADKYKTEFGDYFTWYEVGLGHLELAMRHNTVIIKRFLPKYDDEDEELVFNELEMLTTVKHHNIVNLIGFCVEGCEMLLVTEKYSNGYLSDYFYKHDKMITWTWERRLKICIDVARALNYLHSEMEDKKIIVHGNIHLRCFGFKENWDAKLEDFECAVFLPPNKNDEGVYNKQGLKSVYHEDPEYMKTGKLETASDVYSFGVVLFEIVCGRYADDPIYRKERKKGLVDVARRMFCKGETKDIDPTLKKETGLRSSIPNTEANMLSLQTFLEVAKQCVVETQDQRPTMKVVLMELEKALSYQEKRLQKPDKVVNELEIAPSEKHVQEHEDVEVVDEIESRDISEKRLQKPDKVFNELEIAPHEKQVQEHEDVEIVDEIESRDITEKHVQEHEEFEIVDEIESRDIPVKKFEHLKIRLSDVILATDDFSDMYEIASWDSYTLYRAKLDHFGKENPSSIEGIVVIKRYTSRQRFYKKQEFFMEIEMLSMVKNPYIVTLLGFCFEGSEMILVIENMSNGYLVDYLRNVDKMRTLTWEKRLKICIDVAHAIKYLHYEMEHQKVIINRDISRYSIWLNENLRAKIVDFRFSVFLPPNQEDEAVHIGWIGIRDYADPEHLKTCKLKRESDVYSFGVILFEILCGRASFEPIYLKEKEFGVAPVARRCYDLGTLHGIIDPIIMEENSENNFVLNRGPNKNSLHTFIEIAYKCVAETQHQRPTMNVVVKELEKALSLQNNKMNNPRISLEDIKEATQNFHYDNLIGGGGFGGVFKGKLLDGDGVKTVVAKRLDKRLGQGEQQFWNEIQILLEYKHENVIGLIGYCDEKYEKVIVYEYAPKGSLDRYLKDASLTWVKRLLICIDIASALYFLHGGDGKKAKVIHRDIKAANILLNHEWKAKLGDFGLSLISPITQKAEYVIDYACGTQGYVDPLYEKSRFLTIESDIYSFGVLLFEILCGRSTFEIRNFKGHYMPDFIKETFEKKKHNEVVFEKIREQMVPESLATFQEISYQCLHHEREKRPTTKKVLLELKKALEFQVSFTKACGPP